MCPEGNLSRAFPACLTLTPASNFSEPLARPAPDSQGHGHQMAPKREAADASGTLLCDRNTRRLLGMAQVLQQVDDLRVS